VIRVRGLTVVHPGDTVALRDVDVDIEEGDFAVLVGPSGGGKSTLLRCLNGLVKPTAGQVIVDGTDVGAAGNGDLLRLRRKIAFIPQQFNLVKRSSVLSNVLAGRLGHTGVAAGLLGLFSQQDRRIAWHNISRMGLADKARRRIDTLSGGEQQRVAICRSLTQQPKIILADEPVSNLDHTLATRIMETLRTINREDNITMLVALHGLEWIGEYADKLIGLSRGSVVYSGTRAGMSFEDLKALTKESAAHG
jgi:phosphonate transport system ATP-binding protein